MEFFKKQKNTFICNYNTVAYIPKRYSNFDFLSISTEVTTFGIFDIEADDKLKCLALPAMITLTPSDISQVTIDEVNYIACSFNKDDIFMNNDNIIKNPLLVVRMFEEFIAQGHLPRAITYENCIQLFEYAKSITGINFYMDKVMFELIYAHLYRDSEKLSTPYRLTNRTKPPTFIGLRNVAYGPDSTSAKIFGAYFDHGLNSALINKSEHQFELEDIMRS